MALKAETPIRTSPASDFLVPFCRWALGLAATVDECCLMGSSVTATASQGFSVEPGLAFHPGLPDPAHW